MLYYLFTYLDEARAFPGAGLFGYISFRASGAIATSLLITILWGKRLIDFLRTKQIGETVRELGLDGQKQKQGTPTMGGLIIIAAIIIPTVLFAKLGNIYVILLLISTVWMGTIGFLDDYIKVFKKNKEGLTGKFKIIGQVGLGLIVGITLYLHPDVQIGIPTTNGEAIFEYVQNTKTTLPLLKENEFDYQYLAPFFDGKFVMLVFVFATVLIITAVSNGANLTDGIDGLAAGTSAIIVVVLSVFVYVSGRTDFTNYLKILYIPNIGELTVFCAAFVGACIGFLWYNAYPAQIFMGDTGSLTIGGLIAVLAICVRKELLTPIICGVFVIENLSVVMQVSYFKYTKRKFGEGRRIFKMAPLHHHYQIVGVHESKIVSRFWIVGVFLAVLSLVLLKLR